MKIIPEVKCRRCGETFSSLRSRCPRCGVRRVSQSSRVPGTTPGTVEGTSAHERANANTKWQMVFGLILVVAVILAVVVMVSTGLNNTDVSVKNTPVIPSAEAIAPPTAEAPPTPTPTPPPAVETIVIRYYQNNLTDSDFTMTPGDAPIPLSAYVTPMEITDKVTWSTNDENEEYIKLNVDPDDGNKVTVECLQFRAGGVKIFASMGDKTAQTIVYMNNPG